jgi:hypothetical protein
VGGVDSDELRADLPVVEPSSPFPKEVIFSCGRRFLSRRKTSLKHDMPQKYTNFTEEEGIWRELSLKETPALLTGRTYDCKRPLDLFLSDDPKDVVRRRRFSQSYS